MLPWPPSCCCAKFYEDLLYNSMFSLRNLISSLGGAFSRKLCSDFEFAAFFTVFTENEIKIINEISVLLD
jgi:hypothetical protein